MPNNCMLCWCSAGPGCIEGVWLVQGGVKIGEKWNLVGWRKESNTHNYEQWVGFWVWWNHDNMRKPLFSKPTLHSTSPYYHTSSTHPHHTPHPIPPYTLTTLSLHTQSLTTYHSIPNPSTHPHHLSLHTQSSCCYDLGSTLLCCWTMSALNINQ